MNLFGSGVLMKNQQIFLAVVLIGIGFYFFLQQANITISQQVFTWPTLLMIAGAAFLGQGYIGKDYEAILPGVILIGYGLYYHILQSFPFWSNPAGSFILIIAIGCLLRWQKTHSGLFQALLFFILAIFLLFYDKFTSNFGLLQNGVSFVWKFWPILLIGYGVFILYKKKK